VLELLASVAGEAHWLAQLQHDVHVVVSMHSPCERTPMDANLQVSHPAPPQLVLDLDVDHAEPLHGVLDTRRHQCGCERGCGCAQHVVRGRGPLHDGQLLQRLHERTLPVLVRPRAFEWTLHVELGAAQHAEAAVARVDCHVCTNDGVVVSGHALEKLCSLGGRLEKKLVAARHDVERLLCVRAGVKQDVGVLELHGVEHFAEHGLECLPLRVDVSVVKVEEQVARSVCDDFGVVPGLSLHALPHLGVAGSEERLAAAVVDALRINLLILGGVHLPQPHLHVPSAECTVYAIHITGTVGGCNPRVFYAFLYEKQSKNDGHIKYRF
jgi:hypothetical protein